MIGQTISHYQIVEKLGQGGMGVVYMAQDTKLNRSVALKFLPTHTLPSDDERLRFQREARAAAALNHPNIATVHEIDATEKGEAFIAMEFVEGGTLEEKIGRGPLHLEEAIRVASYVAEGLEAAHEKGIVHRDIKAANVMFTGKDQVKIMDFGLAKMAEASLLTQEGSTMGTVYYMSPEQTRGEEVDHRADLWALGVLLYEMVSGQLPFKGAYSQAVLYSIMNEDPEALTGLRTGVPMALEWIVTKLLAKERENRYQSATDLLVDLRTIDLKAEGMSRLSTTSRVATPVSASRLHGTAVSPDVSASASRRFTPVALGLTALLTAVLASMLVWFVKPVPEVETPTRRFRIQLPGVRAQSLPSLSPDGSRIAFYGADTARVNVGIFVYEAQAGTVHYVPDSSPLWVSAFSPEGRWIVMKGPAGLFKVPAAGGTPVHLADQVEVGWITWLSEDELVVAEDSSLYRLSVEDGTRVQVAVLNPEDGHDDLIGPSVLPGGRHVLVTAQRRNERLVDLVVFDLEAGTYRVLVQQAGPGLYVRSGHLIYLQGRNTALIRGTGQLMARPFDARTQVFTGNAVPLPAGTLTGGSFNIGLDGTFVSIGATEISDDSDVFWIDSTGMRIGDLLELRAVHGDAMLSPDGRWLAYERDNSDETDIWVYDLVSRTENRLSFAGYSSDPAWSPDGRYVVYPGNREDGAVLLRKPVDGSSTEEVLPVPGDNPQHPALSQDGRRLAYEAEADGGSDIMVVATDDMSDLWRVERPKRQRYASFSPDGRFVVFQTEENDQWEVYVQVVGGDAFWAVSAAGEEAIDPVWSWDGRYIYYTVRGVGLQRVRVETEPSFRRYTPETVFRMDGDMRHAHHKDGGRILLVTDVGTDRGYLDLVLGFDEELKRLAPPDR